MALVARTRSQVARSTSSAPRSVRKSVHAALWSSRSTPPNRLTVAATAPLTASASDTSQARPTASCPASDQLGGHGVGRLRVPVGDGHPGAQPAEVPHGGGPDAPGRPRHQGHLALEGAADVAESRLDRASMAAR